MQIKSVDVPTTVSNMLTNLLPIAANQNDEVSWLIHPDALGSSGGGGDMPSGGIMMSDQDCPDGWSHYDMAGRMPVGTGEIDVGWWAPRSFALGDAGGDTITFGVKSKHNMSDKYQEARDNNADRSYWSQHDGEAYDVHGGLIDSFRFEIGGYEEEFDGQIVEYLGTRPDADWINTDPEYVYSPHKVLNFCQKD